MKRFTRVQWMSVAKKIFGTNEREWAFVCPSCGCVTKVGEWIEAGASSAIAFSCIGRFNGKGDDKKTFMKNGGPCMYAGGGLLSINPVLVIDEQDKKHYMFDFTENQSNQIAKGEKER